MLGALRDLVILIASVVVITHASGKREWLWKKVAMIRQEALVKTNEDWGCPSIFKKTVCHKLDLN